MSLRTYKRLQARTRLSPKSKGKPCPPKPSRPIRLSGPAITELRSQVFNRANGRCHECDDYAGWLVGDMHHVQPRGQGGADTLENCVWLCRACHSNIHGNPQFSRRVE